MMNKNHMIILLHTAKSFESVILFHEENLFFLQSESLWVSMLIAIYYSKLL